VDNDFSFYTHIVTTLLSPVFLGLLIYVFLVRKKNRPGKTGIRHRIKNTIETGVPFIVPKSIRMIQNNLSMIEGKMARIRSKIKKTGDYINILNTGEKDGGANNIISRQKEYYEYMGTYYDEYCSLYLETRFQLYMALVKDILIAKNKIHDVNINRFVEILNSDMEFTRHTLVYDNDFERYFSIIGDMEALIFFTRFSMENERKESGDNTRFPNLDKSMAAIKKTIPGVTVYLVTVQSHKIIGDTSPLDEEHTLNIYRQENDLDMIFEHSKKLDEEYDRFAAEIELSEKRINMGIPKRSPKV
jgi:hypothetical protein